MEKKGFPLFIKTVRKCALLVTPERSRAFRRRCRKYMLSYKELCVIDDTGMVPSLNHKDIEAAVKSKSKKKPRRKRKRTDKRLTEDDLGAIGEGDLELAYLTRRPTAVISPMVDDRFHTELSNRLESEVNMVAVQDTQSHHRAAVDMDTAWINAMVDDCMIGDTRSMEVDSEDDFTSMSI